MRRSYYVAAPWSFYYLALVWVGLHYWVLAYRQGFLGRCRFGYRRVRPLPRSPYPLQANSR
jgi:hypothetical protein